MSTSTAAGKRGQSGASPRPAGGPNHHQAMSRRLLISSFVGALASFVSGAASATREAERRKDRAKDGHGPDAGSVGGRFGDPLGGGNDPLAGSAGGNGSAPSIRGAAGTFPSPDLPGVYACGCKVIRIDDRSRVGAVQVNRLSRKTSGANYVDSLEIHILNETAERLNPAVEVSVRPSAGLVWDGRKTFVNRGASGSMATFSYSVTTPRGSSYELWMLPFIEDARPGSPSNGKAISQNQSTYVLVGG